MKIKCDEELFFAIYELHRSGRAFNNGCTCHQHKLRIDEMVPENVDDNTSQVPGLFEFSI